MRITRDGLKTPARLMLLAVFIVVGCAGTAFAQSASSSNYKVSETQFGAGANSETCSTSYCSRTSIGDLSAGNSSSASYTANFGPIVDSEPLLEMIVDPGESNLGNLATESTATKTVIVRVRNYLSDGYQLQIVGNPPKFGNHTLSTPATPVASTPGTEQFGINVAANTTPSVGAAPVQVPSGQFSFGVANDDYSTPNLFKYTAGDVVAHSNSSSGRTDYTISMIVNISELTPAGHYSGDFAAVAIPVF